MLAILAAPLLVLAGQVNAASLALDRAHRAPAGTPARQQGLQAALSLLQRSAALAGSWQTVRLGAAYLELGRQDEALAAWTRAPAEATAYLWSQGDAHWLKREPAQAEPFYRMALDLSVDPQTTYRLGRALQDEDQWSSAVDAFRQALAVGSDEVDIKTRVDIHLRLARLLAMQQQWDAALAECDLGLSLDPNNGDLMVARAGISGQAEGDPAVEEGLLLAAINNSPGNLPVYKALFAYYGQSGQLDLALRWAEAALEAVPGSAWPQIMLGRVALAQGRPDDALLRFRHARLMRPDLADPLIGMASAYLSEGDVAAALAQGRLAVQTEPYRSDVYSALGDALRASGDEAAARQAYQQALSLDAGNTQASAGLASLNK